MSLPDLWQSQILHHTVKWDKYVQNKTLTKNHTSAIESYDKREDHVQDQILDDTNVSAQDGGPTVQKTDLFDPRRQLIVTTAALAEGTPHRRGTHSDAQRRC